MKTLRAVSWPRASLRVLLAAGALSGVSPAVADVSHKGWPVMNGEHLSTDGSGKHTLIGTDRNDEILGGDGSDHLVGGRGADVIWGDKNPTGNGPGQHDVLSGGPGNDWIYPSHGTNIVRAGSGADHIKAYYGHGSIDCGPGHDTAQVQENGAYTLHDCEHVVHFCAFGSFPDGTCKRPGEAARFDRGVGEQRRSW